MGEWYHVWRADKVSVSVHALWESVLFTLPVDCLGSESCQQAKNKYLNKKNRVGITSCLERCDRFPSADFELEISLFRQGSRSLIIPTLIRLPFIILLPLWGWRWTFWRIKPPCSSRVNLVLFVTFKSLLRILPSLLRWMVWRFFCPVLSTCSLYSWRLACFASRISGRCLILPSTPFFSKKYLTNSWAIVPFLEVFPDRNGLPGRVRRTLEFPLLSNLQQMATFGSLHLCAIIPESSRMNRSLEVELFLTYHVLCDTLRDALFHSAWNIGIGFRVHHATLMDIWHLKNCGVGTKITTVSRQCRAQRRQCTRRFWSLRSVYWTRLICVTDDCCKRHESYCKITRLWWTKQLMQYQRTLRYKLEDAPRLLKIPKRECPDVRKRLPRQKWPKSWEKNEDPVVPLERNLNGHPLAGWQQERQFEEASLELGWEKFLTGNVCSFIGNNVFPVNICGWLQMTVKKQNVAFMWKNWCNMWILKNPHHFLTTNTWDVLSVNAIRMKRLSNNMRKCLNHVFLLEELKNYRNGKTLTHKQ